MGRVLKLTGILFSLLLLLCLAAASFWFLHSGYSLSPDEAELVYSDLERFARVAEQEPAAFGSAYLEGGSRGLAAYAEMYQLTEEVLQTSIAEHPETYDAPLDLLAGVKAQEPAVRATFERFESLYPGAIYPPTWYLVGGRRAGGANGAVGILIAAELHHDRMDEISCLVAHELTHFNHATRAPFAYAREWNNLARAIKEGAADFMAERTAGCHTNETAHAWGLRHEAEIWEEFRETLDSHDTGEWFWAQPSDPERPRDLGYFIGYRIVQSYFDGQPNEEDAIRRIMTISDFEQFLAESGYERLHHSPGEQR